MIDLIGRRVRWPVDASDDDQSLIGLVVATAAENYHTDIGTILGMAGIQHARGLGLAMQDQDRRAALAYALGQPLDEVVRRAHLPISGVRTSNGVDFFGACVPSHDVHHGVRRVGATNDPSKFYHRALWQLPRVPIDVSSGFRVTAVCMSCNAPLGWRNTVAPQRCDECGGTVNNIAPPVDAASVKSAVSLAELLDPRPSVHVPARDRLHPSLRGEDRGVVFYLGYRLGLALTDAPTLGRLGANQSMPFEDGLRALDLGARVIAQWPDGISDALLERTAECSHKGLDAARAVQRVATIQSGWPQHQLLLGAVLPGMQRTAQSFLGSLMEDALDAAATAEFLGLDGRQVSQLHRAKAIPTLMEGTGAKVHALFSKAALNGARDALEDQMSLASVAHAFGISQHGVEQFVCEKLLAQPEHKAVATLYAGVRVSRRSMTAMITKLEGKRQTPHTRTFVPAISLRKAARVVGGREKPWAAVFGALMDGNIKFTMLGASSPCLIDRVRIDPADAATLFSGRFHRNDHKHFPFVIDMARREAAELLNLNHKTTIRVAALPSECYARDKRLVIAPMLLIAAKNISPLEVKARWGIEQPFGLGEKTELGWLRVNAEGTYGTSRPQSVQGSFDFACGYSVLTGSAAGPTT